MLQSSMTPITAWRGACTLYAAQLVGALNKRPRDALDQIQAKLSTPHQEVLDDDCLFLPDPSNRLLASRVPLAQRPPENVLLPGLLLRPPTRWDVIDTSINQINARRGLAWPHKFATSN